jgi:hypothetical protein
MIPDESEQHSTKRRLPATWNLLSPTISPGVDANDGIRDAIHTKGRYARCKVTVVYLDGDLERVKGWTTKFTVPNHTPVPPISRDGGEHAYEGNQTLR